MISVCLAAYNGERFIRRQLESILPQLDPGDEVVVSDDGSTDQTVDIVQSFRDPRIRLIRNRRRRGPVGNFENALYEARGESIFLSDQDDIWLPDKVQRLRPLLAACDLVLSDCTVVDETGKTLHPSFFAHRGSQPGLLRNLYKNSYVGCCMVFRRSLLKRALPFPQNLYMHDWWLGLVAELNGRVCFYDQPTLLYVRHGQNVSPTGEGSLGWGDRIRNRFSLLMSLGLRMLP